MDENENTKKRIKALKVKKIGFVDKPAIEEDYLILKSKEVEEMDPKETKEVEVIGDVELKERTEERTVEETKKEEMAEAKEEKKEEPKPEVANKIEAAVASALAKAMNTIIEGTKALAKAMAELGMAPQKYGYGTYGYGYPEASKEKEASIRKDEDKYEEIYKEVEEKVEKAILEEVTKKEVEKTEKKFAEQIETVQKSITELTKEFKEKFAAVEKIPQARKESAELKERGTDGKKEIEEVQKAVGVVKSWDPRHLSHEQEVTKTQLVDALIGKAVSNLYEAAKGGKK